MKQNKETLKQFFETGDKPTQQQYADLIDSYIDAKQPEGEANRRFVIDETGEVSIASEQQVSEYTLSPISGTNTVDLLKDGVSVSQIDLTPYLDNTNLARLVSGTVDTNGLATFTRDDNSTFTVDLSNLKDTVPQYQAGSNITIDTTDPSQPVISSSGSSIDFADEKGEIKYSSLIDKRTGYYDTTNDVYYPNIHRNSGTNGFPSFSIDPIDSFNYFASSGSGSNRLEYISIPDNRRLHYSMDVYFLEVNQPNYVKANLQFETNGSGGFNNKHVTLLTSDNTSEWAFYFENYNGKSSIGIKNLSEPNNYRQWVVSVDNITVHDRIAANFDPTVLNSGWEFGTALTSSFSTSPSNILQGEDILPHAKPNGVQSVVAGTNVTIDNTDPLNPIINAAGGGGSTNLTYTPSATQGTVESDSGTNAVIPAADAINAGLMKANFYEEGTFTPTLIDTGGGATYSITVNEARYIRTGNKVFFTIQLSDINTSGTPSTSRMEIQTTGLPFILNADDAFNVGTFYGNSATFYSVHAYRSTSNNIAFHRQTTLDGSNLQIFSSNTITGGIINISGTYITNVYTP